MQPIKVANVSDLPTQSARTILIDELEIALFKLSSGEIRALENKCPHKQGKLSEGIICESHVYCPLHDWKINMQSGQAEEPDQGCVTTYSVEIDSQGNVIVFVPPQMEEVR